MFAELHLGVALPQPIFETMFKASKRPHNKFLEFPQQNLKR